MTSIRSCEVFCTTLVLIFWLASAKPESVWRESRQIKGPQHTWPKWQPSRIPKLEIASLPSSFRSCLRLMHPATIGGTGGPLYLDAMRFVPLQRYWKWRRCFRDDMWKLSEKCHGSNCSQTLDSVQTSLPKTSIETRTNYDKSPTQTWKRPTTWNPSPQKRVLSSCSATTRLKTQSWGPHVDPPKRTTWSSRRDTTRPVTWGKHGETAVTPTAVNFSKKNWDWKIIYQPFCKGHPIIPPKKYLKGTYMKNPTHKSCTLLQAQGSKSLAIPYCEKMRNEMIVLMIFKVWKPFFIAQQAISTNDRRSTPGKVSKKPSHSPTRANL